MCCLASCFQYCQVLIYDLHPSLPSFLPSLLPSLPSNSSFLSTSLTLCLCCSVDEAVVEDQQSDQSHSPDPETEVQVVDQEQQQERQELEDGLSDFNLEGKTSQHHHEEKVSSRASQVFFTCVSNLNFNSELQYLMPLPYSRITSAALKSRSPSAILSRLWIFSVGMRRNITLLQVSWWKETLKGGMPCLSHVQYSCNE